MPRKRQEPAAQGMESGAGYGEKGENLAAQDESQGGIALPATRDTTYRTAQTPDGTVVSARPEQQLEAPLDMAQQWIPNVTPLTAPDDRPDLGLMAGSPRRLPVNPGQRLATKSSERATNLIRRLAQTTGNPRLNGLLR
jgi:hypothetical protein